jgi:hypothetical protein
LGNTLENSQQNNINTQLDFTRLYAKSKWLRNLDYRPLPPPKQFFNNQTGKPVQSPSGAKPNPLGITLPTREEAITDTAGNRLHGKKKRIALRKWRQQRRDYRTAMRLQQANQPAQMNRAV